MSAMDAFLDAFCDAASAEGTEPLVQYQEDPVGFLVDVLGVPEATIRWTLNPEYDGYAWDGTPDPLVTLAEALVGWQDVGVESGTGTGKSFFLACVILWFLGVWKGARVFTFAPKEDQLRLYIWAEISKLWPRFVERFPTAELTDLRIRMDGTDEWGAWGYSVGVRAGEESATKAQGMHAEHMMLVYEETPGIALPVIAAGENTCTAPHNVRVAIGNPDHQADALHAFCTSPGVVHVRMSALDHPNVVMDRDLIPGAVSTKAVERRRTKYGEDSRLYQSRVRGISPAEAEDSLIRWSWCVAAAKRYEDAALRAGKPALGVDVANSENGDKAAIARWQGACLTEVESFQCPDASELGKRVGLEMEECGIEPRHVGVDSVGVGASTVNKLKEMGFRVKSLNGGARAFPMVDETLRWSDVAPNEDHERWTPRGPSVVEEERYNNLRSQMWWTMREDLRLGRVAMPNDEALFRDLTTPTFKTHNGKIIVEPKEDIRARLGRSPDQGDATVYGNFVRSRKAVGKPEKPKKSNNEDHGLERLIARHHEREKRNGRRFGHRGWLTSQDAGTTGRRKPVDPAPVASPPPPAPRRPVSAAETEKARQVLAEIMRGMREKE